MRINSVGAGARAAYYDRNPLSAVSLIFQAIGVAPHATTTRATYTVPTGRKALVTGVDFANFRDGTATTVGEERCMLALPTNMGTIILYGFSTVIGTIRDLHSSFGALLLAGTSTLIQTDNVGIAGSLAYALTVGISEYDA